MTATSVRERPRTGAVLIDDAPEILRTILRPDVSLAIWDRAPPFSLPAGALEDLKPIRFSAARDAVAAQAHAALDDGSCWQRELADDAGMLATRFGEVMGVDRLDVRLEKISGNACWKIHADYVTARLITTLAGRGTEWFETTDPGIDATPPLGGRLGTGAVGLFKGRSWAPDTAILHRSPPIAGTGEQRLLLVMDPAR